MDIVGNTQISILAIGILIGLLPVALGVLMGAWMTRRQSAADISRHLEAEHAQELVNDLIRSASRFAGDVGEYRTEMERISHELDDADQPGGTKAKQPHMHRDEIVARMAQMNSELQRQLDHAETALAQQAEQLTSYLSEARTDALTGLPNRRSFDEAISKRFAEWQRRSEPLSVMLLDIDRFKALNDEHGHLAGDAVLRSVARLLADSLRDMDTAARFGGEEFALILPGNTAAGSKGAAERARKLIEQSEFPFEGKSLRATISCGVAQAEAGEGLPTLLKRADEALYASKSAGRNCGHYHDGSTSIPFCDHGLDGSRASSDRRSPPQRTKVPENLAQACQDLRNRLAQRLSEPTK